MVAYLPSLRTILLRLRASSATPSSLTALTSSSLTQTTSYCPQSSPILPLLQHTTPQPPISGQILASSPLPLGGGGGGGGERKPNHKPPPKNLGLHFFPFFHGLGMRLCGALSFLGVVGVIGTSPFLLSLKGPEPCEQV